MDKPLPKSNGVVLEMYDAEQFSRDAITTFADLRVELEADTGSLHCQMGILAALVRRSLNSGDSERALAVREFLKQALKHPRTISEIENAVAISFLEAQEFRTTTAGELVLNKMPERIREIILEQERRDGGT